MGMRNMDKHAGRGVFRGGNGEDDDTYRSEGRGQKKDGDGSYNTHDSAIPRRRNSHGLRRLRELRARCRQTETRG